MSEPYLKLISVDDLDKDVEELTVDNENVRDFIVAHFERIQEHALASGYATTVESLIKSIVPLDDVSSIELEVSRQFWERMDEGGSIDC